MKVIFAVALCPLLVLASPVPEANSEADFKPAIKLVNVEKRAVTCALTDSNVRYRRGPGTNYAADGQFGAAGTRVSFSCFTTGGSVNGNSLAPLFIKKTGYASLISCINKWFSLWNKIASGTGAGDYVSDYYITRACSALITTSC